MNEDEKIDFKLKHPKSKVMNNTRIVLPLIEEISKANVLPVCLVGYSADKKGKIHCYFSTVSDDKNTLAVLVELFKRFIEHHEKTLTPIT